MPKETFQRLRPDKKKRLTDAFLREFAVHSYDDASLTSVVKGLGIAKGSVYQYFDHKLDLFLYLAAESSRVKQQCIGTVKRDDHPDYWSFLRALYEAGLEFDRLHPLESHFLHSLDKNINSPSLRELHSSWLKQTHEAFTAMVQHEIDLGNFRKDVEAKKLGFILYKALVSINDYMQFFHGVDARESITKNEPVYAGEKAVRYMEAVDEHILLLRKSLENEAL